MTASPTKARRFPGWIYALVFTVIVLFSLAPILSMLIASTIAQAHGCYVDEGSVHPCVIGGMDWGETFYTMTVLCWFMFFTLPIGAIAFFACLVLFFIHLVTWRQKRRTTGEPGV